MEEIKQRIIAGGSLTAEEALSLLTEAPFEALCQAAHEITKQCAPRVFDMCSIINAKSGRCPENCKWCAQSAHHNTRAEIYGIVPVEECLRHARLNESQGVKRFSLVTSGRRPTEKETEVLCEHFAELHRQCGIVDSTLCFSGTGNRRPAETAQGSRSNTLSLQSGNCTFLFRAPVFHSYTGTENRNPESSPRSRNGYLQRWNYRHG